ncbi:hypothetical protein C8Q78DRAFT_79135 [Trametes maxima]|nr:hypothetical protein C8Q78DRAFT_79135 [Trametes maxima]
MLIRDCRALPVALQPLVMAFSRSHSAKNGVSSTLQARLQSNMYGVIRTLCGHPECVRRTRYVRPQTFPWILRSEAIYSLATPLSRRLRPSIFPMSEAFQPTRPCSSSQRSDKRDGIYRPRTAFPPATNIFPPLSSPLSPSVNFLSSRTSVATVSTQEIRMGRRPTSFRSTDTARWAARALCGGKQCRRPPPRAITQPSMATFSRRSTSRRTRFVLREGVQKHSAVP